MITVEFIKQLLDEAKISGISGITLKNHKIFITIEVEKDANTYFIQDSISVILEKYVNRDKIQFIFTNKNNPGEGKKKHYINDVKSLILVASGKGGVGKSTVAVSLANQYNKAGHKVGIVDADIYGPSIPTMFEVNDKPKIENNKFIPIEKSAIKIMSVGFLVDFDAPIAWRGPMASKMLYQMLSATAWGDLDYLIVDMPPGTGDIHLSILENYHIDGVVMVTTPQKISMIDVDRAIRLYSKFEIPILAIIENMSDIFPGDAGTHLARKYTIANIQKVAFDKRISQDIFIARDINLYQ